MAERKQVEKVVKGMNACLPAHDPDCDLCPYDSIDLRCRAKLRDDIMALLDEYAARVLTLEDLLECIAQDKRKAVYLQQKDGDCREPRPALYTRFYGENIDLHLEVKYVESRGYLEQISLYAKDYLRTWCLWSSMPTDVQIKEMMWDA